MDLLQSRDEIVARLGLIAAIPVACHRKSVAAPTLAVLVVMPAEPLPPGFLDLDDDLAACWQPARPDDVLRGRFWFPRFACPCPTVEESCHLPGGGWRSYYRREMLLTEHGIRFARPQDWGCVGCDEAQLEVLDEQDAGHVLCANCKIRERGGLPFPNQPALNPDPIPRHTP